MIWLNSHIHIYIDQGENCYLKSNFVKPAISSNQPKQPQSYSKQIPHNLPLVPKPLQSCTTHAAAAVEDPGDLLLVPKQPQSCSKHAEAAEQVPGVHPLFSKQPLS